MLRWSGTALHAEVDLAAIADGTGDGGLPHGRELIAFASAIAGFDDDALDRERRRLLDAAGAAVMIDAAAVAANFEMMTRVADGTGARFGVAERDSRATLGAAVGIGQATSAR